MLIGAVYLPNGISHLFPQILSTPVSTESWAVGLLWYTDQIEVPHDFD